MIPVMLKNEQIMAKIADVDMIRLIFRETVRSLTIYFKAMEFPMMWTITSAEYVSKMPV